jgi:hypothetical protein
VEIRTTSALRDRLLRVLEERGASLFQANRASKLSGDRQVVLLMALEVNPTLSVEKAFAGLEENGG